MTQTRNLRALVFDLDGTLLDTAPDFVVVVNRLLAEQGRPPLPAETISASVSNGARGLVSLAFGLAPEDPAFEPLRERLLELYAGHLAVHTRPYPGIMPLVQQATDAGLAWGIATNKPWAYTQPLLDALDMQPAPGCVICPDHVHQRKPDPESLFLAAELLGCRPQEIVYVGDHQRDIDCGRNAGALTIAAAYGYIEPPDHPGLWNADHTVASADDIWPIIEPLLKKG